MIGTCIYDSFPEDVAQERRRAARRMRESEERLRRLVEHMPVLMVAGGVAKGRDGIPRGKILAWNEEARRVTGYTAAGMIGNPRALDMLDPSGSQRRKIMATVLASGSDFRNVEVEIRSKGGVTKTVAWSSIAGRFPIRGWDAWAIGVEVTGSRRAQEALRESEEPWRSLVENAPDEIAMVDAQGRILYVNQPGAQTATLRGTTIYAYLGLSGQAEIGEALDKVFRLRKPQVIEDLRVVRGGGRGCTARGLCSPRSSRISGSCEAVSRGG